jgi:hypothetical protein
MKLSMISKNVLPGLALLLATSAFAANKPNKGSLDVSEPVTVSGQQLKPGEYKLGRNRFRRSGDDLVARCSRGHSAGSRGRSEQSRALQWL